MKLAIILYENIYIWCLCIGVQCMHANERMNKLWLIGISESCENTQIKVLKISTLIMNKIKSCNAIIMPVVFILIIANCSNRFYNYSQKSWQMKTRKGPVNLVFFISSLICIPSLKYSSRFFRYSVASAIYKKKK